MKLGWFSELDARERRTFFAAFGGLGLDSMDTTIFALVMPVLISLAILTKAEAGALASLSLIGCGIGGWFAGSLAGRFGRVRMLQMTVVWVAVFTAIAAFMHGFWGFAFGRGGTFALRVALAVQSGYAVGYAVSVAAMPVIFCLAPRSRPPTTSGPRPARLDQSRPSLHCLVQRWIP